MNYNDLLSKPGKDISVTKNRIALYGIAGIEEWATQNADAFKSILHDALGVVEDADVQFFERPQFSGTRLTELITPMMKWLANVENGGSKPDGSNSVIIVSDRVETGDRDDKVFWRFSDQVGLNVKPHFASEIPEDATKDQITTWIETGSFASAQEIDDEIASLMGASDEDEVEAEQDEDEVVVPEKPSTPPPAPSSDEEEDEDPFSSFSSSNEEEEAEVDPFASFAINDDDMEDLSAVDEYERNVGAADINTRDSHEVSGNTVQSNIDSADQYLSKATGGKNNDGGDFTPQRQQAMDDETVHNASTEMHSRPSEAGYGHDIRSTTRVMADFKNSPNSNERESRANYPHLSRSNVFADAQGTALGISGTSGGVGKTACSVVSAKTLAANVDQYNENNRIPLEQRRDVYLLEMDFTNPDLAARENIPSERTLETLAVALDRIGPASFNRHANQSMSDQSIIETAIERITYVDEETGLKMIASPHQVSVDDKVIQRAFIKVMEHLSSLGAIIVIDMPNFDATDPFLVNIIESFTTALFVIAKPSGDVGERELSRVTKSLTSTQHVGRAQALGLSTERVKVVVNKATNEDALELRRFSSGCEVIGHIPTFPEITTGRNQDIEGITAANMQNLQVTLLTFIGRSLSIGKIPEISGIVQDYDPSGFVPKEERLGFFARIIQFFTR